MPFEMPFEVGVEMHTAEHPTLQEKADALRMMFQRCSDLMDCLEGRGENETRLVDPVGVTFHLASSLDACLKEGRNLLERLEHFLNRTGQVF